MGLLGAAQATAVQVYPLDDAASAPEAGDVMIDEAAVARAHAWASIWGADHGCLTASITPAEKDALVAAGALELSARG